MGVMHLKIKIKEKFKLKTTLTGTKNLKSILYKLCRTFSSSKCHLNFSDLSTGSGEVTSGERDLLPLCFKKKQKKTREGLLSND